MADPDDGTYLRLLQDLEQGEPTVQTDAVDALAAWEDARAVPLLCRVLRFWDAPLRQRAAEALGRRADPASVHALGAALWDEDHPVCCSAARSLGRLIDPRGVPYLCRHVDDNRRWIRSYVWEALDQLQPVLATGLCLALKDPNEKVRLFAAAALRHHDDPRVIPALVETLNGWDGQVAYAALQSLHFIARERPVPELRAALVSLRWKALLQWPPRVRHGRTAASMAAEIHQRTQQWANLPMPASAPIHEQGLPIPSSMAAPDDGCLPGPAAGPEVAAGR